MSKIDIKNLSNGCSLTEAEIVQLNEMNQQFTHVLFGSKNKVATIKDSETQGKEYIFLSLDEFANYVSHIPTIAGRNAGRAWFNWPGKNRKLNGIGFYPNLSEVPKDNFNIYIPSPIQSIEGDCDIYLEHILNVICAGDNHVFTYVMQFLAHIVQKPTEKPSVAIVLKSVEGTGKGTMLKPLLQIFGCHGAHINGDRHITGQFNGAVANKLLVFADEVDLTHSKDADKVKAFISENTVLLEKKGLEAVPIPNYARLFIASNRSQVISAGLRERRYLVLEPIAGKAQDKSYFSSLHNWIDRGGASKLLHHLQQVDIGSFDPYKAPVTRGLIDQKMQSMPPCYQFIKEHISAPSPFLGEARVRVAELIERYVAWCQPQKISVSNAKASSEIGKLMTALCGAPRGRSNRGEGKIYDITDVEKIKLRFASLLGLEAYDIFD